MNISEANATAHLLRREETAKEREFLAERAGKALGLSTLGVLTAPRYRSTYCQQHGARRDVCGCTNQQSEGQR